MCLAKPESESEPKKEFKKPGKIKPPNLKIIGFALLFVLGAVAEHYVAEPFFNSQLRDDYAKLQNEKDLLNQENATCLGERELAQTDYSNCRKDLDKCADEKFVAQQELNNCRLA